MDTLTRSAILYFFSIGLRCFTNAFTDKKRTSRRPADRFCQIVAFFGRVYAGTAEPYSTDRKEDHKCSVATISIPTFALSLYITVDMEGFFFAVPLGAEDDGCDAVFESSCSSLQMSQLAPWAQPSSTTCPIVNNQLAPFMNAAQDLNTTAWNTDYPNNPRQLGMAVPFSPFQRQVPNAPMSLHPHSISMNATSPDQGRSSSLKRLRESTENLPLYPQFEDGPPPAKKRAPKAPTMDAKKWAPAEIRIRQLFVDDGLPYNELRNIVNKEFGFSAT
jgi:hypothetical protein